MFLELDRRNYCYASEVDPMDDDLAIDITSSSNASAPCENQFRAARGWESKNPGNELQSLKNFDQTGLMGMVCRHGCPLRYLNMYTGERARHGISLLKGLLAAKPLITHINCCYDISCIFTTTVAVSSHISGKTPKLRYVAHCTCSCQTTYMSNWTISYVCTRIQMPRSM